jgi:hypothetical protein
MTSKTRSSENANDTGRRFDKLMVLAPPVGFEPTTNWLTASAFKAAMPRSQLLYRAELQRRNVTRYFEIVSRY